MTFKTWGGTAATGDDNAVWKMSEAGLTSDPGNVLPRLPAHRVYWFGWVAQFPKTLLGAMNEVHELSERNEAKTRAFKKRHA